VIVLWRLSGCGSFKVGRSFRNANQAIPLTMVVIADAGLPVPPHVEILDLALAPGTPLWRTR